MTQSNSLVINNVDVVKLQLYLKNCQSMGCDVTDFSVLKSCVFASILDDEVIKPLTGSVEFLKNNK